ncbi:amidase [Siminovitchia terrae]|uniref:Amidase n=1 Tax=Siminovitchia terrae TaxID=1914933 RepID=A0ABQ4L1R8_SIMTE|nr:amidase family protein [Siminovitchia terrae]GIN98233.1 amidase [Siminovitchia terrae]
MDIPKFIQKDGNWLIEATIDDMQKKMAAGEVTSLELVQMYLRRIAVHDEKIHSILEINPDALHIAAALDEERKTKGTRGPLHGIPILVKDNIDTGDRMHTSAGSLALASHIASSDAFVAGGLRKAGAVLLGKTNMTEWANFMTIGMPSGYSSRGGQTLNPYGPGKLDVGGSSSGSGAAVACNFAAAAIGTETSGSILNPSLKNALVGIKPTVGLLSRRGIIPIAHSQDTPGPMARTVKDAAYLLGVMAGRDDQDPVTEAIPLSAIVDYAVELQLDDLKGVRIGVAGEPFTLRLSKHKLVLMEEAKSVLKELGAELVEDIHIPSAKHVWGFDIFTYEFKVGLNAYLQETPPSNQIRSLADVIRFNETNSDSMLKYGQKLLEMSEETRGTLTEPEYHLTLGQDLLLSREEGIDHALKEHRLDAIFFGGDRGSVIAARAGYPTVIVPAGFVPNGEPFGVSFTGTAFSEALLLKIAYAFEQATHHRKSPEID